MYLHTIVNVSTSLLSSRITAINSVLCLREKVQRYPNQREKVQSLSKMRMLSMTALLYIWPINYSATWDPSMSAKLRTIKEMIAADGYLYLLYCDNYQARDGIYKTCTRTHTHTNKLLKFVSCMLNVLGNACKGVL